MTSGESLVELFGRLERLEQDVKEIQDVTGISFNRWKAHKSQFSETFIRERIKQLRADGYGLMEAGKAAVTDLKEYWKNDSIEQENAGRHQSKDTES